MFLEAVGIVLGPVSANPCPTALNALPGARGDRLPVVRQPGRLVSARAPHRRKKVTAPSSRNGAAGRLLDMNPRNSAHVRPSKRLRQKGTDVLRVEPRHTRTGRVPPQFGHESVSSVDRPPPHEPEEVGVEPSSATGRSAEHVRAEPPSKQSPQAPTAWRVDENDEVGARQPRPQGPLMVAVMRLRGRGDEATNRMLPVGGGRTHPSRSPVVPVEVHHRKSECPPERDRHGRLARARAPDDHDPTDHPPFSVAHTRRATAAPANAPPPPTAPASTRPVTCAVWKSCKTIAARQ